MRRLWRNDSWSIYPESCWSNMAFPLPQMCRMRSHPGWQVLSKKWTTVLQGRFFQVCHSTQFEVNFWMFIVLSFIIQLASKIHFYAFPLQFRQTVYLFSVHISFILILKSNENLLIQKLKIILYDWFNLVSEDLVHDVPDVNKEFLQTKLFEELKTMCIIFSALYAFFVVDNWTQEMNFI